MMDGFLVSLKHRRGRVVGLSCSVTLEKKGTLFWAWTILVGQLPTKMEKGATEQLGDSVAFVMALVGLSNDS